MLSLSHRIWLAPTFWACVTIGASGQDPHPAFTQPAGFQTTAATDQDRRFEQTVPNGDRLRIHVMLPAAGTDPEAIAKGPALEEGDKLREDTKQAIKSGSLTGVSFSTLGRPETIDGVAYTRYRRVMGLKVEGHPTPVAVRADILAREPRPAQSTLESMARALTAWQEKVGGVSTTPPPDPEGDPASKPAIGGDQIVRLTGGGDLEIQVPAFWGRADLKYGEGHEELVLGPARDVIAKITAETLAKDKDRIGPCITITRIQKDAFKDLVDVQLLDIKESLLADYVAQMADSGVTLTLSADRDEGTLGTRTVISVPFEEKRSSGTTHRGRSVFMMHKGSLVIVTASHPVEKFDEGWPDIAKAFDTLLFTGSEETAESGSPETRPPDKEPPAPAPSPEQPAPPSPTPGEPPPAPGPSPDQPSGTLAAAPAAWTRDASGALKNVEFPSAATVAIAVPAGWSLFGDADPAHAVQALLATPRGTPAQDPLGSAIRVDVIAFHEELAGPSGLARLASLMRLRIERDAREIGLPLGVPSAQDVSLAGRTAHALQYTLQGAAGAASGTLLGAVLDGTAVVIDLRIASGEANSLMPLSNDILSSIRISVKEELSARSFGHYSGIVPSGWEVSDSDNPAGGRNVFFRSPAGVDVRLQTAPQKRKEGIDLDVLRRVASGFLVEGLKVLTLKDMETAQRVLVPGGGPGLRFEATTPQMDVLVLAMMLENHMVFALRGAPPNYRGRDLAVAWAAMQNFGLKHVDRTIPADPVRVAGSQVARRVAFARTEIDGISPNATLRSESSVFIALLPDGSAGYVLNRNGKADDLRGTYSISGDVVTIDSQGLGRLAYRLTADGETLQGSEPGDVLFRARHEESP